MHKGLKWLGVITSAGMFLVLLAGALVTKTDSGRGCGDDWPLCNGKFVPAYTIESMIEYSHRAVSGVVGLLVLFTALWVWKALRHRRDAINYAFGALFFTILQAILGAMAVVWGQSSAVMALHFGFSLIAFSCTLLLAILLWGNVSGREQRHSLVTPGFANLIWGTTIYSYIVVYIGAFVRHTDSSGGCIGWPLCNGDVIPTLTGATTIAFGHRVAAALLFIIIIRMAYIAKRDYLGIETVFKASITSMILIILQVASGAGVAFSLGTNWYVFASLLHTVIIAGLFGVLCYMSFLVMPRKV